MGIFSQLFGGKRRDTIKTWLAEGAVVIDVRSPEEFSRAHFKGSENIPLDQISSNLGKIKGFKRPVIVCCASGMRSAQAKRILENEGIQVENAGGWQALNRY